MSSLIPLIRSYVPTSQQIVRAVAPITADYIVIRFLKAPRVAEISSLGTTLALLDRNVTTLELVANSLLYFAYKTLHHFFFKAENKTQSTGSLHYEEITAITTSLLPVSNFEKLQTKFQELLTEITWLASSSFDNITPSEVRRGWSNPRTIARSTALFELAARDSGNLYDELAQAAMDTSGREQRNKKMAELLMDKNQPYYGRLCDPSKPSILFLYHLARGYGYYTRVGGTHWPHSFPLEESDAQPFYQDNTAQSKWRSIYNEHVALWANILKYLPVDSVVRKCAVTDTSKTPLDPMLFPDNFLLDRR